MCVKPYFGWRCGHPDLSATELPLQPCGPPERHPYEPFCSPPIYMVIHGLPKKDEEDEDGDDAQAPRKEWQEDICPACCEVYSRVDQQWYARKASLIDSRIASERDLDTIDKRLHERTISVLEKGQMAGPDHTLHLDEYELQQTVILRDMDRLLDNVWKTKTFFRDSYTRIKDQGLLPVTVNLEYMERYLRAELRRTELSQEQNDRFARTIRRYVEELNTAHDRAARQQEARAACQSPDADPLSSISALFAEGEPEGEAGPSDK